ncbi:hypothetical protein GQ42DRAFT_82945 [Ramicandelaber brevisporus]|nr:hypothetical protein GQ42DRAFT_82945 [Ramicandelaber brevisporus]
MRTNGLPNPVPNKRLRLDEDTLVCDKYWLPAELIAHIISFFHFLHRPVFRLVSKKWYIAYDQYYNNSSFSDETHVDSRSVTRRQVVNAFANYGHRLRWMHINTSTLREMLDTAPTLASLIPNVTWLNVKVNDGLSSQRWIGGFVAKLCKLRSITIKEFGATADEHLVGEMEKAIPGLPRLQKVDLSNIDLDSDAVPGPNMRRRASKMLQLVLPIANIAPGSVASTFAAFKSVTRLGFTGISSANVLKEVTDMVTDDKNFSAMHKLDVHTTFDLSHAVPIINEEDGTTVTAMDLYLKICGIQRPKFELRVGFVLGACSTTNKALIKKEQEFVIKLGRIGAKVLVQLELTHYAPAGEYDPLTTFFYYSAPRYPALQYLSNHVSPTTATGSRIIEALNNPFLLPHLIQAIFLVDGTQAKEWNWRFNPIKPSRGATCSVIETRFEDHMRNLNERNGGVLDSWFSPN